MWPSNGAQRADLSLRWVGHATVTIDLDGVRILTDPVLRDRIGPLLRHAPAIQPAWYEDVDAVVVSHWHRDHLDLPSLRALGTHVRVIVPRGAGLLLSREGFQHVEELSVGQVTSVGPVRVEATPANHSGSRHPGGPQAATLGYLLRGRSQVYFAGDTDLFAEMDGLARGLDAALLPVAGWGPTLGVGHMDERRAAEALLMLRPRFAVPIHWGTLWPMGLDHRISRRFTSPGGAFLDYASVIAPRVDVRVIPAGSALHLPGSYEPPVSE